MTLSLYGPAPAGLLRQSSWKRLHGSRQSVRLPRHDRRDQVSLSTVVGIDLGTSNSAIGIVEKGDARIVRTSDGSTTSSCVAFTEDKVYVGSEARRLSRDNPEDSFSSVKRLIGTTFDKVSAELQYAPFRAQPAPDGSTLLCCPARQATYTPQEVSAHIVRRLVSHVEKALGSPIHDAVITVPAHFTKRQRAATAEAGALAGLKRVRLLQEPVAAVIAYGLGRETEDYLVLVVDLGGGTYDVSLVECFEGCLEVIGTTGDAKLGGDDWDRAFMQWVLQRVPGDASSACPGDMQDLLKAVESAKQRLSECEQTSISVPGFGGSGGLHLPVTRTDFEEATAPLLSRLLPPLKELGAQACISWAFRPDEGGGISAKSERSDCLGSTAPADKFSPQPRRISHVALVGGATRMPSVQAFVSRLTGLPLKVTVDPALCVALGATIYGGMLEGTIPGGIELADGAYSAMLHDRYTGF